MLFFLEIRRRLKWWLISFICWGALAFAFGWLIAHMVKLPWGEVLRIVGPLCLCWAVATPILFWLVSRIPIERDNWKIALPVHLTVCFATLLGFAWLSFTLGPAKFRHPGKPMLPNLFFGPGLPIYIALVSAAHASHFYRRAQERERRSLELAASLAKSRLHALQMQIQPHFLFNSLNALDALIRTDADAAKKMLPSISDFLRLTLESSGEQRVPLGRELQFAERYLEIEKIRFGDRLSYEIDASRDTLAILVPALLLQPLVENAVRHGIEPQKNGGRLVISARRNNETLLIRVIDNGFGPRKPMREGVGLTNARERLRELYGSEASLAFDGNDEGAVVSVKIPLRAPK